MRVGIGNDHAGVDYKKELKKYLESKGYEVIDYGSVDPKAEDNYPEFGMIVAEALMAGDLDKGVVVCGTGVGISIAANKVPGIRCGVVSEPAVARLIVEHNDANMIALGERFTSIETAKACLDEFFAAEHLGGRHARRVDMIKDIEKKYLKD